MLYLAIIGDIVFQIVISVFYAANRKSILRMTMLAFYGERNHLYFGNLAYCLVILCLWFVYCFMVHNTAPVLMGSALGGWAEFVFLYLPTLIVPLYFNRLITEYYIEMMQKVSEWHLKNSVEKELSDITHTLSEMTIKNKVLSTENARLKAQIGEIQDKQQKERIVESKRYFSLSDIIRVGLYKGGEKMSDYAIRQSFPPNGDTVVKCASNDNGIFVLKTLLLPYSTEPNKHSLPNITLYAFDYDLGKFVAA